ncbi:MAG: chromosome segregation and condensation protein ScpB [Daejeonella sp.]|nr:chromosome segregation and condensation protein ScpB [Daejeonella sp.]
MEELELQIEALIFASEKSLSVLEIKQLIEIVYNKEVLKTDIHNAISSIQERYKENAIELIAINDGYQFLTKNKYHSLINQLQLSCSKKNLSQAALETLAIVAYKQPITKIEIEQIRGVNCEYTIQRHLEKELISIAGKANTVGKPILYITSNIFMDHFGLASIKDLPIMNDIVNNNQIGKQQD